jgi:hypothetical protein
MAQDMSTDHLWTKAKKLEAGAWVSGAAGIGILLWYTASGYSVTDSYEGMFYASIGLELMGGVLMMSSQNQKKKAILQYNQSLEEGISLRIQPAINGVKFIMYF